MLSRSTVPNLARPAIIYARYSSDGQNPLSCRDQLDACRAWAATQAPAWEILGTYQDDAISGRLGRESRAGFDQLLAFVEAGHLPRDGAVLVFQLDRFSREYTTGMIEMLRLAQAGVHLADTSNGLLDQDDMAGQLRAFLGFLTASDWVRKHSAHVRRGIRSRVAKGYFFGKPPYGYRKVKTPDGPTLEPHPEQAPHLVWMFEQAAEGISAHAIGCSLTKAGVKTHAGKTRWHTSTVRAILCNPTYAGVIVQYAPGAETGSRKNRYSMDPDNIQTYPGQHPALVTKEQVAQVRALYFKGTQANRHRPRKYALSGLLICEECGRAAVMARHDPPAYRCHPYGETYDCNSRRLVRKADLENAVTAWALKLANDTRALDLAAREAVMKEWEQAQRRMDARAPIEREISNLEQQITSTFKLVEAGNAPALVNSRLSQLEKQIDKARQELLELGRVVEPAPVELARQLFQEQLRAGALDLHKLRGLIDRIIMPSDSTQPVVLHVDGSTYPLGLLPTRKK